MEKAHSLLGSKLHILKFYLENHLIVIRTHSARSINLKEIWIQNLKIKMITFMIPKPEDVFVSVTQCGLLLGGNERSFNLRIMAFLMVTTEVQIALILLELANIGRNSTDKFYQ